MLTRFCWLWGPKIVGLTRTSHPLAQAMKQTRVLALLGAFALATMTTIMFWVSPVSLARIYSYEGHVITRSSTL